MPLPTTFYDIDGEPISLLTLCKQDPEWAEIRIKTLHEERDAMEARPKSDLISKLEQARKVIQATLVHQVANLNTPHEFYTCYTYQSGTMPDWVEIAKAFLKETT